MPQQTDAPLDHAAQSALGNRGVVLIHPIDLAGENCFAEVQVRQHECRYPMHQLAGARRRGCPSRERAHLCANLADYPTNKLALGLSDTKPLNLGLHLADAAVLICFSLHDRFWLSERFNLVAFCPKPSDATRHGAVAQPQLTAGCTRATAFLDRRQYLLIAVAAVPAHLRRFTYSRCSRAEAPLAGLSSINLPTVNASRTIAKQAMACAR